MRYSRTHRQSHILFPNECWTDLKLPVLTTQNQLNTKRDTDESEIEMNKKKVENIRNEYIKRPVFSAGDQTG